MCSYWAVSESHQCAWQSLWISLSDFFPVRKSLKFRNWPRHAHFSIQEGFHSNKQSNIPKWCQYFNYSVGGSVCSYWAASESHQCAWQSLWIKMNMQQQQMGKIDSQSLTYDSSTYLTGLRKWRGVNYVVQYWQETTENILEIHQWFSFWHDM